MVPSGCVVLDQFGGIWFLHAAMVSNMWIFDKTIEVIFLETSLRRDEINFRADGIAKERGSVLCS
jgi:hypothetical protein